MTVPLADIEAAGRQATEGPWERSLRSVWIGGELVADTADSCDARYIAAVDPPTVLAMLDALRLMRDRLEGAGSYGCECYIEPDGTVRFRCRPCEANRTLAEVDALVDFAKEAT